MAPITKSRSARKGFTLIELAIIIAIVGILAAVGAVKYASMTADAQQAGQEAAVANARSALAIAIAKSTTGTITWTDYSKYLESPTKVDSTHFKIDKYTITFSVDDTNIQSIVSAAYTP